MTLLGCTPGRLANRPKLNQLFGSNVDYYPECLSHLFFTRLIKILSFRYPELVGDTHDHNHMPHTFSLSRSPCEQRLPYCNLKINYFAWTFECVDQDRANEQARLLTVMYAANAPILSTRFWSPSQCLECSQHASLILFTLNNVCVKKCLAVSSNL